MCVCMLLDLFAQLWNISNVQKSIENSITNTSIPISKHKILQSATFEFLKTIPLSLPKFTVNHSVLYIYSMYCSTFSI